jgi:hypothetical protein
LPATLTTVALTMRVLVVVAGCPVDVIRVVLGC